MKKVVLSCLSLGILTGCVPDAIIHAGKNMLGHQDSRVWLQTVRFEQSEDVNENSPVTVDVLVFHDKRLFEKVKKMSAAHYFEKKEQLERDYPTEVDIFSYHIIPGHRMHDQHVELSQASGVGCIVFAHYHSPGAHRVVIGSDETILIELEERDFTVKPVSAHE